jgi:hypothetical protein
MPMEALQGVSVCMCGDVWISSLYFEEPLLILALSRVVMHLSTSHLYLYRRYHRGRESSTQLVSCRNARRGELLLYSWRILHE